MSHTSICECLDCITARRTGGPGPAVVVNDPQLAKMLAGEVGADKPRDGFPIAHEPRGGHYSAGIDDDDHMEEMQLLYASAQEQQFPTSLIGSVVIGAATIKDGTTHAVVLRDPLTGRVVRLYWERNATTSGKGEWAILPER